MTLPTHPDPWGALREFTAARIALGRSGEGMPTGAVLQLSVAHAAARDAVHQGLDVTALQEQLRQAGLVSLEVTSHIVNRSEYLRRPDLGRRLSARSAEVLAGKELRSGASAVIVLADGLSAHAVQRHGVAVTALFFAQLPELRNSPIVIATQARVALGDEIGELLKAEFVVVMIGERPGLSSPDSLGIYLTRNPRMGCNDSMRNCISNIRPEGLSYHAAAAKLAYLIRAAKKLGHTGVALKDMTDTNGVAPAAIESAGK